MNTKPLIAAVPLALLGAVVLSGYTPADAAGHLIFENKHAASVESSMTLPAWLPDDASTIVVEYPAGDAGYLLKFASGEGVSTATSCSEADADASLPAPDSVDWWPKA